VCALWSSLRGRSGTRRSVGPSGGLSVVEVCKSRFARSLALGSTTRSKVMKSRLIMNKVSPLSIMLTSLDLDSQMKRQWDDLAFLTSGPIRAGRIEAK
jgi:hypothetical protein